MRILYLSQYFPPEAGATQTRAYEMARNWVRLGHRVTMVTEFPNHPSGIIPKQYHGKIFERDKLDGIEVLRVWVKASPIKNFRNRMLFYLSYMLNAIIAGLFLAHRRFDYIYATSPPLFVGGAALAISYLRRIPLTFEVRDLWPESAVALGELNNPRMIAMASWLEEKCYRRARILVVVTQGICERLIQRGIQPEKIVLIPNGANTELFTFSQEKREQIRNEMGLANKFIALYAGIHGLAQGLETVLEAARLLKDNSNIHFVLIGDGPKKAEILHLAKEYNIPNLSLMPEKPRDDIPGYLSAADVALIPLRKLDIFKGALPSKIFDAWACERPVLLSIDGEAREIVEKVNGGVFIPPENPDAMAEAIVRMMDSPEELKTMGDKGRKYTMQYYSRCSLAEKLIGYLQNKST